MIDKAVALQTVEELKKRGFGAYFCESAEEAKELALSLIPSGDTVAWGGSVTAEQIGLIQAVKSRDDITRIDRDLAKTPEEKRELMRRSLLADTFIAGRGSEEAEGLAENIDTRLVARSRTPTDAMPSTSSTEREMMMESTSGAMARPSIRISEDMFSPISFGSGLEVRLGSPNQSTRYPNRAAVRARHRRTTKKGRDPKAPPCARTRSQDG